MADDDLKSAGIAILIMAVVNAILLAVQFTIGPIFVYDFEFLLFQMPLLLLVAFFLYLWIKRGRAGDMRP